MIKTVKHTKWKCSVPDREKSTHVAIQTFLFTREKKVNFFLQVEKKE